jgi:hypothetical protein
MGDQPPATHRLGLTSRPPLRLGTMTLDASGLRSEEQSRARPDSAARAGHRATFRLRRGNNLQIVANAAAADQVAQTVKEVDGVNPDAVAVAGEQAEPR